MQAMSEQKITTTDNANQDNWIWYIFWPLLILFTFFYYGYHPLSSDEGLLLNASWQIWNGKKMYVDFVEYISPGSAYSIFWLWKLFGTPSYFIAKAYLIVSWLFSALGVFFILKLFFRKNITAMIVILFWLFACGIHPLVNHNTFSSLAAVWALLFFLRASSNDSFKRYYNWILAGVFSALTLYFLQTKGLMIFAAGCLIALIGSGEKLGKKLSNLLSYVAPILALTSVSFIFWKPSTLFYTLFIFPNQAGYMQHTYIVPLYVFLQLGISLIMLGYALWIKNKQMLALGIFQSALFLSSSNIVEICHFMVNSFPFWIFLALILEKYFIKPAQSRPRIFGLAAFCLLTWLLFIGLMLIFMKVDLFQDNIISVDLLQRQHPLDLLQIKEMKQAKYMYGGPFIPGLYYEFRKENPFFISNMLLCDQKCHEKMLLIFQSVKPEFALLCYGVNDFLHYNSDNPVDNYIRSAYHYCEKLSSKNRLIYAKDYCPSR
jgi:hypothetical protein